jgi:predicted KAP-like P-loop ATPase
MSVGGLLHGPHRGDLYASLYGTGPNAQIRKSKKVRDVIKQHRESFKPLIGDFGFHKVADIVKALLDQRVFQYEMKAKIAFPELFKTSPAPRCST